MNWVNKMSDKTKSIIRKIIYAILFLAMIGAFIYLGEKYASNSEPKVWVISDFYNDLDVSNETYEVIRGKKMISLLKDGKSLIFIGSKSSPYSAKYMEELNKVIIDNRISKVYYYDLDNDKGQRNSNYYNIRDLLNGYLTATDDNNSNLLAPSFYIIDGGKVKYYNTDTAAMKNTETVETYWTEQREIAFRQEITEAINKYYLNK